MTLLVRTFLAQFLNSETVTSETQTRQAMAGVLAFLVTPGLLLLLEVFPDYQAVVIRVHAHRLAAGLIDDRLEWIVLMLCTYSMVTVGLVAAYAWDALTFDRRDALVLGPLPIRGRTIVAAKLGALAVLVLGASIAVNSLNAIVFALETSDLLGARALVSHMVGFAAATVGGALVVFAWLVTIRNGLALLGSARLNAIGGSLVQGAFVVALLSCVVVTPFVGPHGGRFGLAGETADRLPWTWFVGLFETIRHSPRRDWPEFTMLTHRAIAAVVGSVAAALLTSILAFRQTMRAALAPAARPGPVGEARMIRFVARLLVGRDRRAAAVSDFVVTTFARNRTQQGYVAMNVAVGVTWVLLGLMRARADVVTALRPAPLLLAFWAMVGLRASFFVPSELEAAWTFRFHVGNESRSLFRGVRSATLALVAPAIAALAFAVGGWRPAVMALLVVIALANVIVRSIDFLPFTRAYEPGHARLKTRWPLYPTGCALVAYALPLAPIWALAAGAALLHFGADRAAWHLNDAEVTEESTVTTLDLLGSA